MPLACLRTFAFRFLLGGQCPHADPRPVADLVSPPYSVDLPSLHGEPPRSQFPRLALAVGDHIESRSDQPREQLRAESATVEDDRHPPLVAHQPPYIGEDRL